MTRPKLKSAIAILAVGLFSFTAGTMAQGRYGEINQSITSLQTALAQMRAARDVFGGHKATAENLVQQAVGELQAGKAFAASHGY
jgi:ABC-type transporter Mla subunit MlaD